METQINNGPLFKRIAAVMAAVRSLPKDGHNTQSNFSYVSSDTALDRIGKAMADAGLVIIPMLIDYESVDEKPGSSIRTRTRARFQMHICDVEGNSFLCPWASEGVDYGNPDRALTKAMTYATKYFLLKLFVVGAGGDDPDGEGDTETKAATTGKSQAKAQTKPQQPAKPATNGNHAPLDPAMLDTIAAWGGPIPAQQWAVEIGANDNLHAAATAFKRLVTEKFDGKLTTKNAAEVYRAWYEDRQAKLAKQTA